MRALQVTVFLSVMLTICYYSDGEDALYNPPYLVAWAVVGVVAAISLVRPDPLRLSAGAPERSRRPAPVPVPDGADRSRG